MTYTNSFHHGTERVPGHNRRTLQGEAHIDPDGKYEIWKDEKLADAYDRIFGEALQEYNAKQKRADRKIKSYLQNVRQNSKLNDCYEFIAQVGNEESHPDEQTCHDILKVYFDEFAERNPGLEVIGGYYHADEVGGCPHLHTDYIPTAQNKKTGLKLKNNLTEALKKLGYETEYVEDTDRGINPKTGKPYTKMVSAEMKFQEAEREALTEICRRFGVEIENPKRSKDEYCTSKQLRQARDIRIQNEINLELIREKRIELTELIERATSIRDEFRKRDSLLREREKRVEEKENEIKAKESDLNKREKALSDAEKALSERIFNVDQEISRVNAEMDQCRATQQEVIFAHNFQIRANKTVLEMIANKSYTEKSDSRQLFGGLKTLAKGFVELKQKAQKVLLAPLSKVEEWCRKAREKGCSNLEEYLFPAPTKEIEQVKEIKNNKPIFRKGR